MSNNGRNKVLDATRTVFIRTHRTRLGSGAVSVAELDTSFQTAFGVSVTACRRIANGLIIELLNTADKEKCIDRFVVVRGLRCRVHSHLVRATEEIATAAAARAVLEDKHKASRPTNVRRETGAIPEQPQQRAATTATSTPVPAPVVDPNQVMSDALLALDSQRATPQATAAVLGQFRSLPAFATLLAKSTNSAELVRLLCVDNIDFRDRFANALLQELVDELFARVRDCAVADTNTAVDKFATERLATVARLVGSLAGSRVLTDAEALRAVFFCMPDTSNLVPTCNILALSMMTEHMAGASAAVLVDCVARLERTESFTPPPPVPVAADIRRVCRMHTVSRVAPDSPLRPLANLAPNVVPLPAPLATVAPRGAATTAARTPLPRVDPEYVRVFGAALAAAHGDRLRKAALDTAALVALLEFAPRDRVAIFEGLGIPLGQAVQLATALERNRRTSGAD